MIFPFQGQQHVTPVFLVLQIIIHIFTFLLLECSKELKSTKKWDTLYTF